MTVEISKISEYPDSTTKAVDIDFGGLATNFEFDKEAETKPRVAPVQEDLQKFHQRKVYGAEHLSNSMSGCVGRFINEKKESKTFKQIRQLLLQAPLVAKRICKEKIKNLMKQLDSTLLSGQHDWVIKSLVEKLKSAISQPQEQTRSNVRTEDAYESNIFDLSEEEDEDNIEE
ncbi:hypothetical protein VTP01DRAFT_7113 [Rhizomucor pusillus]|uniref:uncharacterized protein n=1 Tax=Rhizomucor pusillus TaxID=4840 RepID=UPI003743CD07